MVPTTNSLTIALARDSEIGDVDFKSSFDPTSNRDWLELFKDVAAFANSGGGYILVGLNDNGTPSDADVTALLRVDLADIDNRLNKYIGQHFTGIELIKCEKAGHEICAVSISPVRVPIVFVRVGEIELPDGKKKTSFAQGTVYFRHGAKSEPGTSDDLRQFFERELENTRKAWLEGIAKVVEAPQGSRFAVLPPEGSPTGPSGSLPMQLTSDPNAQAYYAVPLDKSHPYRQKEVIREVNSRLGGKRSINSRDVICIRRVYAIQKQIQHCYTQNFASPLYSVLFVDWIIDQFEKNELFFEETRAKFDAIWEQLNP